VIDVDAQEQSPGAIGIRKDENAKIIVMAMF
jgi:hypothetical protein